MTALMDVKDLAFNYKVHPKDKAPIDYLHIIAERIEKDDKVTKKTVNLNKLFRDNSWNPVNLLFDSMFTDI